ncbi:MAG: ABC transporter ATP-binding protein [Oscillospiraceae bacterium]|nr:ABC transporter ATP-binding protein [Oscillospiraceae bacterium]
MNALEIKNLTKHYPGFTLDDVSMTLPSGCIMGLIGENGAGKSTTIKLILGMLNRDGGSIRVLGSEDGKLNMEDIGVVLDEVGLPGAMNPAQIGKVMAGCYKQWDQAAYDGFLEKMALPRKKAFKDFSKGMKMKLGLAVALSHNARLLILDEATSGLDPVARDELLDLLNEFTRDETHSVLFSSHIVSDLEKICDYIAFLHKGKLILMEEKDELLGRYVIVRCAPEELRSVDPACIIGKKENAFGVEAILRRDAVMERMQVSPVSIEELFVFMAKEAR